MAIMTIMMMEIIMMIMMIKSSSIMMILMIVMTMVKMMMTTIMMIIMKTSFKTISVHLETIKTHRKGICKICHQHHHHHNYHHHHHHTKPSLSFHSNCRNLHIFLSYLRKFQTQQCISLLRVRILCCWLRSPLSGMCYALHCMICN